MKRDSLPASTKREIEFSLSLLRIATPGQPDSPQGIALAQILSATQAAEHR